MSPACPVCRVTDPLVDAIFRTLVTAHFIGTRPLTQCYDFKLKSVICPVQTAASKVFCYGVDDGSDGRNRRTSRLHCCSHSAVNSKTSCLPAQQLHSFLLYCLFSPPSSARAALHRPQCRLRDTLANTVRAATAARLMRWCRALH